MHRVLDLYEIATAETVAAYASTADEPGTRALLDALHQRGVDVLLPCLLADDDLDWARYQPHRLQAGRRAIPEPAGRRLGPGAITDADVVICPGLAGTALGHRLGRGGGSYDRALARTRPRALRALLLYDDEVLDVIPVDAPDQPVDVVITDSRVIRTSGREPVTSAPSVGWTRS